jgi:diaminopropionate ammonia-lyase
LARLAYKDEGARFGIGSFKALGGGYAVQRFLREALKVSPEALFGASARAKAAGLTVTCATDGNHGRAVAWAAGMFGCRAVIYVHATVSEERARCIAAFGAQVVRVAGVYEDALAQCAADAAEHGWAVISDTAYPGCMDVPRTVMAGYTVMVEEALQQWQGAWPTHVFIQAGVGGMAAAVAAHMLTRCGGAGPDIIIVEPERADCCYQSALAGRPTPATGDLNTLCAGLACGEVSLLAWEVLARLARAFMRVSDAAVVAEMQRLARPTRDDAAIVAGESAAVGLAGLVAAMRQPATRVALRLSANSRVLLFGSEGATDPELYAKLVSPARHAAA